MLSSGKIELPGGCRISFNARKGGVGASAGSFARPRCAPADRSRRARRRAPPASGRAGWPLTFATADGKPAVAATAVALGITCAAPR
ncbi:hypothetical protein Q7L71_22685 [Conexibacter sp. CPCC 205706]|uniref:hypothetical protein n=1 Tax=unclassified Conexibacter TaxID=2627773 RepID=UPI00271865F1|nr:MULTISPECIES: hypothetical protein [unclassified Conexibacter]MDO8188430.1 hypothetical protein [Conexibacter sp. CPCC 205706]MDO8199209.1 hypothetical protein [Conexibacter sp. CPCC 205762]